jgi:ribonuclease III
MAQLPLPLRTLPQFRRADLRQQALTHKSYANERGTAIHNERLEFLGDAILNFLSGEFLFQRYGDRPEGELTQLRANLVNEAQLAGFARGLNLGEMVLLGRGAERDRARDNPNILSSTLESLIGAYYLDGDQRIEPVRDFVWGLFEAVIEDLASRLTVSNPKSEFQHWALTHHGTPPKYELIGATGPDHQKQFTVAVYVLGARYGQGSGQSKQLAEKDAARAALMGLEEMA